VFEIDHIIRSRHSAAVKFCAREEAHICQLEDGLEFTILVISPISRIVIISISPLPCFCFYSSMFGFGLYYDIYDQISVACMGHSRRHSV
jgi:hypothetical protein